MLLNNKTAIITGANRGIGNEILKVFAQQGADIFACARNISPTFESQLIELSNTTNRNIIPIYFDLSDQDQVKEGIKQILSYKKQIDILVNNAGVASGSFFQMSSIPEMRKLFEVNFFSHILFSQSITRQMARAKSGSVIHIASTAGIIGDVGTLSYGSSKAAMIFATKTMANELGSSNIRVNAIAPSITRTDMYDQMEEVAREKLISSSALKRPAEAYEIANVALFLASDLSSFVNGQTIRVDGGQLN